MQIAVFSACCVMGVGTAVAQPREEPVPPEKQAQKADADRQREEMERRRLEHERHRAEIEARMKASREKAMREGRLSPSEMARIKKEEPTSGVSSGLETREIVSLRREVTALREEIAALRRFLEGQRGGVTASPPAPKKLGQPMKQAK